MAKFQKKIFLDVDDTILKASKRLAELYNEKYRFPHEPLLDYKTITSWDAGLDRDLIEEIFARVDFYDPSKIVLYKGVKSTLKALKERGYYIVIVSKGVLLNIFSKTQFLESELSDYFDEHIFLGSNKNLKMGKEIINMEGSIIVDDNSKNLDGNALYKICAKLMPTEVEWNADFTDENFIMREFSDLLKIVDRIEEFERIIS